MKFFKYIFGGKFIDSIYESKIFKLNNKLTKLTLKQADESKIRRLKNKIIHLGEKRKINSITTNDHTLLNINLFTSLTLLTSICLFIFIIVMFKISDQVILEKSIVPNRIGLVAMMESGYLLMILFLIVARFKLKPKKYLIIVPIVIFSAFIELINVPLLSLADSKVATSGSSDLLTFMFQHIIFSPVKI
ncbi:UNVERIFIED_CONTAM: hypothetical protein O8I53_07845 [Campylobacter lari]